MRYFILISIFVSGCLGMKMTRKLTNEIKQNFTNRFEGRNTGLSAKININGYYHCLFKDELGRYKTTTLSGIVDTSFQNVIFYEDGTFVTNVGLRQGYNNYEDYFNSIIKNGRRDFFYTTASDWGIYSVLEDTIRAQYIFYKSTFTPLYTGEEWFVIKDRNSIQLTFFKSDINQTIQDARLKNDKYVQSATVASFHPVINIPPPHGWLKKESFFWRNKDDWKKYMEHVN